MLQRTRIWLKCTAIVAILALIVLSGLRVALTERGPDLALWHTWVPEELSDSELDSTDWAGYLQNEQKIFAGMKLNVSDKLQQTDPETYTVMQNTARSIRAILLRTGIAPTS
jgi:hypothetical protein